MNIRPTNDRLLVQFDKTEEKTASGLLLPTEAQEKPEICSILSIGPDVECEDLKPGVKIIINHFAGTDIKVDEEKMTLVKESDIIAIVES